MIIVDNGLVMYVKFGIIVVIYFIIVDMIVVDLVEKFKL